MNWNYAHYGLESIKRFGEYEILVYEEQDHEERYTNVELKNRSNALANGLAGPGREKRGYCRGDLAQRSRSSRVFYRHIQEGRRVPARHFRSHRP